MQTGLNHSSIVLRVYKAAFVIFILYSYPLSALRFDIGIVACLINSVPLVLRYRHLFIYLLLHSPLFFGPP
jgi:hypothetical protein